MIKQLIKHLSALILPVNGNNRKYSPPLESNDIVIFKERDAPPSHYSLKIEYFSDLGENLFAECIENMFEVGDYVWNLLIYPNGDEENGGDQDHISVYLEVGNTHMLPIGWEVNAIFNLFVYDQVRDKYVCLQDARERRFHSMRNRWGVTKFIDIDSFYDPSNGYLINDTCIFGAEVFVIKTTRKDECLTMLSQPELTCKYIWKFDDFWTKSGDKWYESDFFIGGDYKWRILFKPNVFADKEGGEIGVGLELDSSTLSPNASLLVNYVFRLMDQTESEKHYEIKYTEEFFSSSYIKDGIERNTSGKLSFTLRVNNFISLTKFKDPKLGFLVNNTCILEVEIDVIADKHPGDLYGGKLYESEHA